MRKKAVREGTRAKDRTIIVVWFVDINRRDSQTASSSSINSLNEPHHHHLPHVPRPHPTSPSFFFFFFCVFRHASPFSYLRMSLLLVFFDVVLFVALGSWSTYRPDRQTPFAPFLADTDTSPSVSQPSPRHPSFRPSQPTN
ncbi:hypothetical protein K457DRAFT_1207801 [Linnemannia elongata AG-77]|uniref:Transmembrane protein n=1 Tax=Linnemannia elongata AG-77 TaxID=1314771 RepID=A0A197K440_9FUNG|nr:hypothetical protein K457DRAFT_1207801 [Linnemannia elongata AG-77]